VQARQVLFTLCLTSMSGCIVVDTVLTCIVQPHRTGRRLRLEWSTQAHLTMAAMPYEQTQTKSVPALTTWSERASWLSHPKECKPAGHHSHHEGCGGGKAALLFDGRYDALAGWGVVDDVELLGPAGTPPPPAACGVNNLLPPLDIWISLCCAASSSGPLASTP
jgi:hypothetical protein